ncbi:hypothetical protein FE257_009895 [Aspergillus nanangensis]|uniref:BHLH domain-containing protein n=1 Tax=Aspergillus nanangensis TaxID=2582783 RepID=A0AAD4GYG2_ASPNN|nr:hypothetical protein FE257_009895 [Aspergillus nanangensis]
MNLHSTETRNENGQDSPNPHPGPFGYSFLSPMDTPYEPAPALPSGPALLDDNESNMLDNFFTTMNSQSFTNDFWLPGQQPKPLDSASLGWSDELPPNFEGSTTSLSQLPMPSRGLEKSGMEFLPTMHGGNPDIFAAASMLYQNGITGTEFNPSFDHHSFSTFSGMDLHSARLNGHDKSQQQQPSQPPAPSPTARAPVAFHTSEMMFDVRQPISAEQQATAKVRPLHWGSDVSFMDQGYVAPPDQPDEEQRTKELLGNLECLERQSSAANTRAPSPERMANAHQTAWTESHPAGQFNNLRREYSSNMEDLSQPKKRQKTLIKEEDDESDGDTSRPRSRRSRGSSYTKSRRMSADGIRKSKAQQSSKAARENLTEEQKRSNHILSEQKRRNLIRQGFDDLCSLVPGLRGGGFSKSAMLTQAADWLEELLRGNEILTAQLSELKTMNGLVMPR